jgi:hypothetical protein
MPIVIRACEYCQQPFRFHDKPSTRRRNSGRFCSRGCCNDWRRTQSSRICLICKVPLKRIQGKMVKSRKFCSKTCFGQWYSHLKSQQEHERFLQNVEQCVHGSTCIYCCWSWKKKHDRDGYGIFCVGKGSKHGKKKSIKAHRYAWEILNKQMLSPSLIACHWCHNPGCINGMHIYPGTNQDNMRHSARDGRLARGERNPNHKLTEHHCREIRHLSRNGWTLQALAHHYNVTKPTIGSIIHHKTWKHIQ